MTFLQMLNGSHAPNPRSHSQWLLYTHNRMKIRAVKSSGEMAKHRVVVHSVHKFRYTQMSRNGCRIRITQQTGK